MTLQITQQHIDQGVRQSATCCPIALALKQLGGEGARVIVRYRVATVSNPALVIYDLDESAQQFIRDFDNEVAVVPITINLTVSK